MSTEAGPEIDPNQSRLDYIKQKHLKEVVDLVLASEDPLFRAILVDDPDTIKDLVKKEGPEVTRRRLPGYNLHCFSDEPEAGDISPEIDLLAAELDAVKVLECLDDLLPMVDGERLGNSFPDLILRAAKGKASGAVRFLLQEPRYETEIRDFSEHDFLFQVVFEFSDYFVPGVKPTDQDIEFVRLLKPLLWPKPNERLYDVSYFDNGVIAPYDVPEPFRTLCCDGLGLLQPTVTEYTKYFDSFFNSDGAERFLPSFLPSCFLYCLERPTLSNQDRQMIVVHYQNRFERYFKDPLFYESLYERGLYTPRADLLDGLLNFAPPPKYDRFLCGDYRYQLGTEESRLQVYRSLQFALRRLAEHATPKMLASVISAVIKFPSEDWVKEREKQGKSVKGYMSNDFWHSQGWNYGLVRLFLYHGVDAPDPQVLKAVLPRSSDATGYCRFFREDMEQVRCWKRWAERKLIGDLPPEICEMVMYKVWEYFC